MAYALVEAQTGFFGVLPGGGEAFSIRDGKMVQLIACVFFLLVLVCLFVCMLVCHTCLTLW